MSTSILQAVENAAVSEDACQSAPHATLRRRIRAGLSLTALMAGLMAATPASADVGTVSVQSVNPTVIEVESDGAAYTQPAVPLIQLRADVNLKLDALDSGRVKEYSAWLKSRVGNGPWAEFTDDKTTEVYELGDRPKWVDKTIELAVSYGSLAPFATGHCNLMAERLRSQGQSDEEIFSQDRVVSAEVDAGLTFEMSGVSGNTSAPDEFIPTRTYKLICKAAPPVPTDPQRTQHDVIDANLSIVEQAGVGGKCRLNLTGAIETRDPNTEVPFRFQTSVETNGGTTSEVKTVTTDHSSTALFNYPYDLPGGGQKSGQIRILAEGFTSAWADFDMTCMGNPGDLKTVLPPKPRIEISTAEVKLVQGNSCPTKIWLAGHIEGRGEVSGIASFVGDGFLSGFHPYSVSDGETKVILASRDLEWKGAAANEGRQTIKLGFNLAGPEGDLIASVKQKSYEFSCSAAKSAGTGVNKVKPNADKAERPNRRMRLKMRAIQDEETDRPKRKAKWRKRKN